MAINVSMELEPKPGAGAEARRILKDRVTDRLPAVAVWDLLTVVTELVENSVMHGPGDPIQVRITVNDDGSV